ncbi:amidohydrolase family protein [Nakamurella sp. YIM 132087]|uniref:Amidohydrolase family protein n=1 Tax=Nakamurella alba TaxID=2665158 RepID=A0A7K1FQC3_9ACTN|nr:amidohydrolase family protein [Nakamurella alba]MTD16352.1 amidohydrolase family protein [Nakamurella alba]
MARPTRRDLFRLAAAAPLAPLLGACTGEPDAAATTPAMTSATTSATTAGPSTPARVLIRGASSVLTMTAQGELSGADILVEDGTITAIGSVPDVPEGTEIIDAADCVALPGLVDTHWHMWNSVARGMAATAKGGFAPSMAALSPLFTPEHHALGVRLAIAEGLAAGITTVHNWAHNTRSAEHAEAELSAMTASGIRGRLAYGYPQDIAADRTMDLDHLAQLAGRMPEGLVSLGICARGPDRSDTATWQAEWAAARELGLPITTHAASDPDAAALGGIAALAAADGLGADVQLVHLTGATTAQMDLAARSGSPVSISPWTELEVGYGIPPVAELQDAGVALGLSVDNVVLAGSIDMFSVMKLTADLAAGSRRTQSVVTDATVLEWATAGGAATLGLGDVAGTLAVGRPADVVLVRTDRIGTAPVKDATTLLVRAAHPADVDLVMVDGVIHKRDGRLVGIDVPALLDESAQALAELRAQAGI